MKKAIEIVKSQGGTISFDPNIRKEMLNIPEMREALTYILEFTDIFLPSGNEVTLLVNASTEASAIEELLALGIKEIIVKNGAKGCTYYAASECIQIAALKVEEIDPTGAGDCFGATYISCRQLQKSAHESLQFAAASGAYAVTKKGPMEGTANFSILEKLLRDQGCAIA